MKKRYTVFIEIATDDDPPWVTYRHVKAENRAGAVKAAFDQYVTENEGEMRESLTAWRVFSGYIQEVEP